MIKSLENFAYLHISKQKSMHLFDILKNYDFGDNIAIYNST